jgi:hypothetical protein
MHRFAIAILPMLFISVPYAFGQVDGSRLRAFSGRIIDDSLEHAVPAVHVWNESTRMGSISDASGEFSIRAGNQDTLVFSAIGYLSEVLVVPASMDQTLEVRLKPQTYEIEEATIRRFSSYESFLYQVVHLDLPESSLKDMTESMQITLTAAALEADRERVVKDKLETGRFGYITPLGRGLDPAKAFKEKTSLLEKRQRVIHAKFNRELVGDITHLEGDDLTAFIAHCNFSDEYLYNTDLYTIMEDLYALLEDYQREVDTMPSLNEPY